MCGAISGSFGEHAFTITSVAMTPASREEEPLVTFDLQTPFGTERIFENIFDGVLPHEDGCWVDRLQEIVLENEELEALLSEVNKALAPFAAGTRLDQSVIEASAKAAGLRLCFVDLSFDETWRLYAIKHDELIGSGSSLHAIQRELRRYRASKFSRGTKAGSFSPSAHFESK